MIALLVIDVQEALISGAHKETQTLNAIHECIKAARLHNLPVVFIQHCHSQFKPMMKAEPGWQLHHSLDIQTSDIIIEKQASDAFYKTNLAQALSDHDVGRILVTGLQTEFCVDATCRAALSRELDVTLVSDGHTTGDSTLTAAAIIAHHNAALANLAHPDHSITLCDSSEIARLLNEHS